MVFFTGIGTQLECSCRHRQHSDGPNAFDLQHLLPNEHAASVWKELNYVFCDEVSDSQDQSLCLSIWRKLCKPINIPVRRSGFLCWFFRKHSSHVARSKCVGLWGRGWLWGWLEYKPEILSDYILVQMCMCFSYSFPLTFLKCDHVRRYNSSLSLYSYECKNNLDFYKYFWAF